MFVNCPNCAALVATDLATDLPPEHCPRCGFALREAIAPARPAVPVAPPTAEPPPPSPPAAAPSPPAPAPAPATPAVRSAASSAALPAAPAQPPTTASVDRGADTPADTALASGAAGEDGAPANPERPPNNIAANATTSAEATAKQAPDTPKAPAPGPGDGARPAKPAPSFARRHLRTAAGAQALRRRWPAVAAVVALALLLALQLLLADRARLAADPQWRPLIAAVCDTLGCTLPPWREPASIVLLQRDVRPHPELAGVLRVNATIRNDARWAQAWPHLVLQLSDIDGRTLGQRRFSPEEYLERPPAPAGMSSGQSATIRIDVLEPSPHTVAFNFDFE